MNDKLTDTAIRNAKPGIKAYRMFDGGGLYLEVAPTGSKLWRMKYRFEGREKRLALKSYPDVPLAQARMRRNEARNLLAKGVDPSTARKDAAAESAKELETFKRVAVEWHTKQLAKWTPDHAAWVISSLEKDAFPWIGNRPVREITAKDVLALARRIEARGAIATAHRVVGNIGLVFSYAFNCSMIDAVPTASLRGALPPAIAKHYPALTKPQDVGGLLRAIDSYTGSPIVKSALRILPYVFTRPGELRGMEWSELDLDEPTPTWTIPAARMKLRRIHMVPLAPQVVAILEELRPQTGSGRFVFQGERRHDHPISENTLNKAMRYMGYTKEQHTAHGFRITASTLLNEMNWPSDHVERQLAHVEQNKIRGTYNHAKHLPERRVMMLAWADYLDGLRQGGKVVPIGSTANTS